MKRSLRPVLPALLALVLFTGCDDSKISFTPFDVLGPAVRYDDRGATHRLLTASIALEVDRDPDVNLDRIEAFLDDLLLEHPDLRLAVLGETMLGWYLDPEDPEGYQRRIALRTQPDDPTFVRLQRIAADRALHVAIGAGVLEGDTLFNALLVFNPEGELVALHRKVDLTPEDRRSRFTAGDEATIVEIEGLRVGLMVCADTRSRFLLEAYPRAGIDILLIALAADMGDLGQRVDPLARMTDAWVVFANRVGREAAMRYEGFVYIADPAGAIRARDAHRESAVVVDIGVHR